MAFGPFQQVAAADDAGAGETTLSPTSGVRACAFPHLAHFVMPPIPRASVSTMTARAVPDDGTKENSMSEQPHTGNPGNFAEDRSKASRAGRLGGQRSSGNFSHNRERAAEAGRKGGQKSHGGGGAAHNAGNFAQDRERAAEAGRLGGQHSQRAPTGG
jgi:general stress protein YciG